MKEKAAGQLICENLAGDGTQAFRRYYTSFPEMVPKLSGDGT